MKPSGQEAVEECRVWVAEILKDPCVWVRAENFSLVITWQAPNFHFFPSLMFKGTMIMHYNANNRRRTMAKFATPPSPVDIYYRSGDRPRANPLAAGNFPL